MILIDKAPKITVVSFKEAHVPASGRAWLRTHLGQKLRVAGLLYGEDDNLTGCLIRGADGKNIHLDFSADTGINYTLQLPVAADPPKPSYGDTHHLQTR